MKEDTEFLEDGVNEDPVAKLARERFHIPYLFPLQRMVIANILDSLDYPDNAEQIYQMALAAGEFEELPMTRTLGVLRRRC
jgi:hypothetical protein